MTDTHTAYDAIRTHGLTLPGAHEDFPWGERVLKVDGKVFVFLGVEKNLGERLTVTLKLKDHFVDILQEEGAEPSGYGLGRHGWITFTYPAGQVPETQRLLERLEASYRAVAKKTRVRELDRTSTS
jgi:predicted DNA-binding protein (MmcQ/YjbR family)